MGGREVLPCAPDKIDCLSEEKEEEEELSGDCLHLGSICMGCFLTTGIFCPLL